MLESVRLPFLGALMLALMLAAQVAWGEGVHTRELPACFDLIQKEANAKDKFVLNRCTGELWQIVTGKGANVLQPVPYSNQRWLVDVMNEETPDGGPVYNSLPR